jgi:hypothetical protein
MQPKRVIVAAPRYRVSMPNWCNSSTLGGGSCPATGPWEPSLDGFVGVRNGHSAEWSRFKSWVGFLGNWLLWPRSLFGGKGRNEGSSPELPADCTTDDLISKCLIRPATGFQTICGFARLLAGSDCNGRDSVAVGDGLNCATSLMPPKLTKAGERPQAKKFADPGDEGRSEATPSCTMSYAKSDGKK